jgi:2-keto-3-deoxy-L-rhamnonate aldolase RhmA
MALLASEPVVGARVVVRSETTISAFRTVSTASDAENATTMMLTGIVEALPGGASLDLIVETLAVHYVLGSCADIVAHNLDMEMYCHHQGRQRVMTSWRDSEIRATI